MDRATVTIPGGFTTGREVPHLPPEQYSDLLDRIRDGYALPDVAHYAVDREVELYRKNPDFLDRTFKRGARYLYYIVQELEKRNLPLELALLPVVESAFNPVAYSRSRASGLWQFIPSSGKHYGLEQNWWIDERRDVIEATGAALTYLQYLNKYFAGDWYLAIAAYNGGEGTVSSAVRRNQAAGLPADFFSLNLKAETRDYVPKLLAISRIVRNPEAYGLAFAAIPNQPFFEVVEPGRQVHLEEAAKLAGITREDIFALNPGYNRMTTPPQGPHRLLLPIPNAQAFRQAMLDQSLADQSSVAVGRRRAAPGGAPQGPPWRDAQRDRAQVRGADAGDPAGQRHPRLGHPSGRLAADSGRRPPVRPRRSPRWPHRATTSRPSCPSTRNRRPAKQSPRCTS